MLERAMLAEMASEWKELRCLYPIPFHVLFSIFFFNAENKFLSPLEKTPVQKN